MIDILINIPLDEIEDFDVFTSENDLKSVAEKKVGISFPDESKVKLIKKQIRSSRNKMQQLNPDQRMFRLIL